LQRKEKFTRKNNYGGKEAKTPQLLPANQMTPSNKGEDEKSVEEEERFTDCPSKK